MSRELARPEEPAYGFAEGAYWEVRAHLARAERRGDLVVDWRSAREGPRGRIAIPYVRLRSFEQARRRVLLRACSLGVLAAGSAGALLLAAWHARVALLLIAAGLALSIGGVYVIARAFGVRIS